MSVRRPLPAPRPRPVLAWLLFERWTLDEPDRLRVARRRWPAWRRALRPVGAACWWAGLVLDVALPGFGSPRAGSVPWVVGVVLVSLMGGCVVVGTALTWRDRRRAGRPVLARWWPGFYSGSAGSPSERVELGAEPVGRR